MVPIEKRALWVVPLCLLMPLRSGAVDLGLGAMGSRHMKGLLDGSASSGAGADTQAPSIPTGLSAMPMSASSIHLMWNASADNVGVAGYNIYRGGTLYMTVGNVTDHHCTNLAHSTQHTFTVRARDAAGNLSPDSTSASAFTPAPQTATPGIDKPNPNPYDSGWDYCTAVNGSGCIFDGVRDVRYGNGARWAVREQLRGLDGGECTPWNFGLMPEDEDHCEVAKTFKTGVLSPSTNPHAHDMPDIDLTSIPIGKIGSGVLQIVPAGDSGVPSGEGAFRIPCEFSHMSFNDPIVYPGQPGRAHLHMFFGNTGTNADSTVATIANEGNSTCAGGIANRSSYWTPALIDTTTYRAVPPYETLWYYKTGGLNPLSVQAMPNGLRMISGNQNATSEAEGEAYRWHCEWPEHTHNAFTGTIPACPAGGRVWLEVFFPQCWDGVNLDSPDHKSHLAHHITSDTSCGPSHPIELPILSLNIRFLVNPGQDTANWRLSSDMNGNPAGVTAHADFFEGWNPGVKNTFTTNCLNASVDCHSYLLGNGTALGAIP